MGQAENESQKFMFACVIVCQSHVSLVDFHVTHDTAAFFGCNKRVGVSTAQARGELQNKGFQAMASSRGSAAGSAGAPRPLPVNAVFEIIHSSEEPPESTDDILSVVTEPMDEGTSVMHEYGDIARGFEWRVITSPCGLLRHIEQVQQKFACTASVMPPDCSLSDDRQFFEDDFGIKFSIDNAACMSCFAFKPWSQLNGRSQVWTRKACKAALAHRGRGDEVTRLPPSIGRVLCQECSVQQPGESAIKYLLRMEEAEAAYAHIQLQVQFDVFWSKNRHPMKETMAVPLQALHEHQDIQLEELRNATALRMQSAWQEMPEDAESVSSDSSPEVSSSGSEMSVFGDDAAEDHPIG